FEFDAKDGVFTRIDRRRKLPVTIVRSALGMNNEEILFTFFEMNTFTLKKTEGVQLDPVAERLRGETFNFDIVVGKDVLVEARKRITARHVRELQKAGIGALEVPDDYLHGRILGRDVVDPATGELIAAANEEINETHLAKFREVGIDRIDTLYVNDLDRGPY